MSEVVELSNLNFKILNEAFEVLERVAKSSEKQYYYNIDVNDIILIEISKFDNIRVVSIYLKNSIVIRVYEHANSINVYRVTEL